MSTERRLKSCVEDPRTEPLTEVIGPWFHYEPFSVEDLAEQVIDTADAADRAAGVVRVDTTAPSDEQVERVSRLLAAAGYRSGGEFKHGNRRLRQRPFIGPPCTCAEDLARAVLADLREDQ